MALTLRMVAGLTTREIARAFLSSESATAQRLVRAALHATAGSSAETDWPQIAALYALLFRLQPTPVVELNRAVAIGMAAGPAAGIALIDDLEAAPPPTEAPGAS